MNKKTYTNTTINVVLQNMDEITAENCKSGIISKDANGDLKFEESIKKSTSDHRNPKLVDGKYLSLTRKKNGKYSFNMKTLEFSPGLDGKDFAMAVSKEIVEAFKYINV